MLKVFVSFSFFPFFFFHHPSVKGDKAMTTTTAMTMPENYDLIGWMRENNRAAHAARTLVALFDLVCKATTCNFQVEGFNDNVSICSVLCQEYRIRARRNNRKRRSFTQMFIFMWRFLCYSYRCCSNSFLWPKHVPTTFMSKLWPLASILCCCTVSVLLPMLTSHRVLRRVGVEQPDAVKAQKLQAAK